MSARNNSPDKTKNDVDISKPMDKMDLEGSQLETPSTIGSLPAVLRKVMAAKFSDFDEYQLAKYNRPKKVKKAVKDTVSYLIINRTLHRSDVYV